MIPSLTISPGDTMSGSVTNISGNKWRITLADLTTGKTFSIDKNYTGPGTSAEWIHEAPSNGSGVLPLAHFKPTQFYNIRVGRNFGSSVIAAPSFPTNAIRDGAARQAGLDAVEAGERLLRGGVRQEAAAAAGEGSLSGCEEAVGGVLRPPGGERRRGREVEAARGGIVGARVDARQRVLHEVRIVMQ